MVAHYDDPIAYDSGDILYSGATPMPWTEEVRKPAVYTFYAVQVTTGKVVTELPLSAFSGQRRITGDGTLSATVALAGLNRDRRTELLGYLLEGKFSVVADRDGIPVGEWVIWKTSRDVLGGETVELSGAELPTYLDHRQVPAGSFSQKDQLTIAAWLARQGFWGGTTSGGTGSVAIDIADPSASGQKRDRTYQLAEATVGQRLSELSGVQGGFDVTVGYTWDHTSGLTIKRTLTFHYPQAGGTPGLVIDQAPAVWRDASVIQGGGGGLLEMKLDRDGTRLGTTAYAIGSGEGDEQLLGVKTDDSMVTDGWPALDVTGSWTSVVLQESIDDHAQALLELSQTPAVPPQLKILADGDPRFGTYALGDTVALHIGETTVLPNGYDDTVRIIGWTLKPPAEGPETIDLEVSL